MEEFMYPMFKAIYKFFHVHYHRRYHGIYKHAQQLFVFDLILLGSALILFVVSIFLFVWKPGIARQIEIQISLGEDRIKSGQAVTLGIHYINHSKITLNKPLLAVRLPIGFIQATNTIGEPKLGDTNTLALSSLAPGAEGTVTLHGTLWTEPQKEDRITATLSFERGDNTTSEQSIASYLVNLPESVLKSTLEVRTSTFPGQPLPFTYTLTNTGDQLVSGINLSTVAPLTFDGNPDVKHLTLNARETKTFTGAVTVPAKTGTIDVTITPRFNVNGRELVQSTARDGKTIAVFYPSAHSTVSWKDSAPKYLDAATSENVTVNWRNTSAYTLTNQRIRLGFTPALVDLKKTARENNLKIDGNTLIADATNRTELANGTPGASGSFNVMLYFLPTFSGLTTNRFETRSAFEAQIPEVPGTYFSNPGSSESAPLATALNLNEQVRYYTNEGDQLGRGPLPPTVGQTTKYWIMVEITNTTNDIRDISFTTTLASGVSFTGKQSVTIGPELKQNDRIISWSYKKLPAQSTTGLYFEVSITPSESDVGKRLTLISTSHVTATDDVVGKQFSFSKGALTNVLPSADQGSENGAEVISP